MPKCCRSATSDSCCAELHAIKSRRVIRLSGAWAGWRIQDGYLVAPGRNGVRWTPATLEHAATWQRYGLAGLFETHQVIARAATPKLTLDQELGVTVKG